MNETSDSTVREMDTVSRFGGDEFVVLLTELDANFEIARSQAAIVAEKMYKDQQNRTELIFKRLGNALSISIALLRASTHAGERERNMRTASEGERET